MRFPNFSEEKKLWENGCKYVAGLDEAGRGPLAGPVVAAAVCVDKNAKIIFRELNDSKKLSEKQREYFYKILTNHPQIKWGVGIVSEKVIDKINILEATKLAMEKSIKKLNPDSLLLDGNFTLRFPQGKNSIVRQKSVIAGDQKVMSIAMASIIAKVTRDRIMEKMHKKYPQYGFDKHKGYGTKAHFANLEKFGPCKIHRKSFWPVSKYC
jgi:ribonuclease HII